MSDQGKRTFEALEVLFNFVEDGMAEAALDEIVDALIETSNTAKHYDGSGRLHDIHTAVRSFQRRYRKQDTVEIGFRGPEFDEPI